MPGGRCPLATAHAQTPAGPAGHFAADGMFFLCSHVSIFQGTSSACTLNIPREKKYNILIMKPFPWILKMDVATIIYMWLYVYIQKTVTSSSLH